MLLCGTNLSKAAKPNGINLMLAGVSTVPDLQRTAVVYFTRLHVL
jgi:hypothetical protein